MEIRHILATATALLALGLTGPRAEAELTAPRVEATIRAQNDSASLIDCTVFWGNNQVHLDSVASGRTSLAEEIPISSGDRNFVCKKRGAPATRANISPITRFQSDVPGSYLITCSQSEDGTEFSCTLDKPTAA